MASCDYLGRAGRAKLIKLGAVFDNTRCEVEDLWGWLLRSRSPAWWSFLSTVLICLAACLLTRTCKHGVRAVLGLFVAAQCEECGSSLLRLWLGLGSGPFSVACAVSLLQYFQFCMDSE